LARGARQLVVHEALDTTVWPAYCSWFTPMTNMGASFEGAEITTCNTFGTDRARGGECRDAAGVQTGDCVKSRVVSDLV
jgi:hypothetical protein